MAASHEKDRERGNLPPGKVYDNRGKCLLHQNLILNMYELWRNTDTVVMSQFSVKKMYIYL